MDSRRKKRPAPKAKRRWGWRQTENLQEYKRGMAINRSTTIVAGLFFVVVLFYLAQNLVTFFTTPDIPVAMVRMDSVDTPLLVEGIIVRDETVYTAVRDGVVNFYVNEYARVQPGSLVGSIQNVQAVAGIRRSITYVEEQIFQLHDIRGNLSAADPAVQRINGQIRNMVDQRLGRHISLNVAEAYALRDSIVQNVNTRNQIIVAENLGSGIRPEIGINHGVLMDELDANREPVHIGGGGIVATILDGFESELTFENMYSLSREQTRRNVDFDQIIPRREVSYGEDVFKVVGSNRWYIASYIPNEFIEGWSVGDRRRIYLDGRIDSLSVRVHHLDAGFQDSFVILRVTEYMIDFLGHRSIYFRTTGTVQHGLRIPTSGIVEHGQLSLPNDVIHEGDYYYVVRIVGDEDIIIPVTVMGWDDSFTFVPNYTDFLSSGNVLRERDNPEATRVVGEYRMVQGVYRVNAGIAEFVPIVVPPDAPAGGVHTILEPSLNPGLRPYDHVVTDPTHVREGDIVFSGVR